jgi:hypothetical protein
MAESSASPTPFEGTVRVVDIATCTEAMPAHERSTERALNVIGWAVDDGGTLHAVAVSGDGAVHLVAREQILFDHAVRPTDY